MPPKKQQQGPNKKQPGLQKSSNLASGASCGVCVKHIDDNKEVSIFCDGVCQVWMHRICTGLSANAFKHAKESLDEYLCHYCSSLCLKEEVKTLKHQSPPGPAAHIAESNTTCTAATDNSPHLIHQETPGSEREDRNHKFKLIVYGIKESPKGTPRTDRIKKDSDTISELLQDVDESVPQQSVRDCIRLGQYNESRNRPVMIEFTRARDVTSNRRNLSRHPEISIITKDQRKVESILLKKRWELINNSECERHQVRIKGNSLFVKYKKHGSVRNFEYVNNSNSIDDTSEITPLVPTEGTNPPSN